MSVQYRNQTTGILERVAGFNDTDSILSPSSKNPISNKAVYNALLQKIDKTVTDLINYYDKSQVYTKPEVRALIGSINTLTIEVVSQLPTQDISTTTIYFVGPKTGTNTYDEYVYVGGNWVQIGDTTIDLSNYVTSTNLTTILQSYYTKSQTDALFDDYYDKDAVDDLLDAKQNTLTFDNTPTSGSSNPVTSTGIRTAINNAIVSSAGGSIIKVHHLSGAAAEGDTVTASKGDFSVSSTFDNNGDAIIVGVGEIGNITITATNGSETGVVVINAPSFSLYSITIGYGLDYKSWLIAGGLNPSYYSSLDEVLSDEEAIRRLMTIHDSIDYLKLAVFSDEDESAVKIFNNDLCAKWISLRDYAMDILPTNEHIASIMNDADKYGYGEWAFVELVPPMTSNTDPYGEVLYSSSYSSGYQPYEAFSRVPSSNAKYVAVGTTNQYLGYNFKRATKVSTVYIENETSVPSQGIKTCKIQYSDDNVTWNDASDVITLTETEKKYVEVTNHDAHSYWRVYILTNLGSVSYSSIRVLQFYNWQPKGNVPIMTSDTAPYGSVISSGIESSTYSAWQGFNPLVSSGWISTTAAVMYLGYKFTVPVKVKRFKVASNMENTITNPTYRFKQYKAQASNDGITWIDLTENLTYSGTTNIPNISGTDEVRDITKNEGYYLYYRVQVTETQNSYHAGINYLQFYGREMKVSVPIMTSNTTPYGEAIRLNVYGSSYEAVKAFDGDATSNSYWHSNTTDSWVGYKFTKPVCIKQLNIANYPNGSIKDYTIEASNDNFTSEIEVLKTGQFPATSSVTWQYIELENDNSYLSYRIHPTTTYNSNGRQSVIEMNLYGFDYSERDWDTEKPMHYLYDHGVEPNETLEYTDQGTGFGSKGSGSLLLRKNTSSSSPNLAAFGVNIDCTNYNLVRSIVDDYYSNSAGNTATMITASTTLGDSDLGYYVYPVSGGTLPNHMAMSLSSINRTCYLNLRINSSVSDIGYSYNTELWLE